MPIVNLSSKETLIAILLVAPLIQIVGAIIATLTPENNLSTDSWLFKLRSWEKNGAIYKRIFKVHKWKKYLPDGAKYFKGDFEKKNMLSFEAEYIEKFIKESCRAELVHWLGMVPFILFFLVLPIYIVLILLAYALLVNFPCIITQRYNRPRLNSLLILKMRQEKLKSEKNQ